MGETIADLLTNAQEALQLGAEDAVSGKEGLSKPRSIEAIRKDPGVARDLAAGGVLCGRPPRDGGRSSREGQSVDRCGSLGCDR